MTTWIRSHRGVAFAASAALCACSADSDELRVLDDAGNSDSAGDQHTDVADTDGLGETDPSPDGCAPRELTWRAAQSPRIGRWGNGGIAWHPNTGLRIWGGCELEGEEICDEGQLGPQQSPWPVATERWRNVLNLPQSICVVDGAGALDCREALAWSWPREVQAVGAGPRMVCAYDRAGDPSCTDAADERMLPPARSAGGAASLSIHGGYVYTDETSWRCVLSEDGRMRCSGRAELGAFTNPDTCWLEVVSAGTSMCGIERSGAVTCVHFGLVADNATTFSRTDLSHLSLVAPDACALDADGRVHCAGTPGSPMMTPPDEVGFVDVQVGDDGACALRADGTVRCWGNDESSFVFAHPDQSDRR